MNDNDNTVGLAYAFIMIAILVAGLTIGLIKLFQIS